MVFSSREELYIVRILLAYYTESVIIGRVIIY